MKKSSKPENMELTRVPQHLHLVSSEPVLSALSGPTTPTIKLSAAFGTGSSDPGQLVTSSTPVSLPVVGWSALKKQSQDNKLAVQNVNTIAVQPADGSDHNPTSESNGNDLSVATSDAAEMLSVISSSLNCRSPAMSSSMSMSSMGDSSSIGLLSLLPIKQRFGTLSVADSLMPPETVVFNPKRHNSLPIPGTIDLLTPSHALTINTESSNNRKHNGKRNGKHNGNLSQPSSPSHGPPSTWQRMFGKKRSVNSNGTVGGGGISDYSSAGEMSDVSCYSFNSQDEETLDTNPKQRLQLLVKSVRDKMKRVGNNAVSPAPSSLLALPQPVSTRKRLDSFAPSSTVEGGMADEIHFQRFPCCRYGWRAVLDKIRPPSAIDPLSSSWLFWLFIVAWAYIYNAIVIFLRCSFPVQTSSNFWVWFIFDYMCDAIYILDMIFRMRLIFFQGGHVITDVGPMRNNYLHTSNFKYDLLSLLPLDIFYLITGVSSTPDQVLRSAATQSILLRLPRLIKAHSYVEFVEKYENKTASPNIFRVVQSVGLLLYMIHLNTCMYYVVSVWEGIGTNAWVYHGEGVAYIRCLYRAAKTLITIGNLPKPVTIFEIFFMNINFLFGIFVFATIIGQMRDIVGNAGRTQGAFRRRMDNTMELLQIWKIPSDIQKRVRLWYMYSWDRKELVDELEAIKGVPIKMQTDLAIHVHMATLSKVKLFQDCDKMLLRDLVLKLKPVLYLPGDYICKKGEVGKEMYIIKSGCVQVVGGENNRTVFATLHSGSYFGEISLLSVGSGNRRTADVYSPGYANLFLLGKKTLQEVIVAYPDAQESLKKQAREILKKNQANDTTSTKKRGKSLIAESILKYRKNTDSSGNFFSTVLAAARNQKISSTILKGSYGSSMGSQGSIAIYSASDFSSDDEVFNDRPRRRKFKRKKNRRRSKSAIPFSTNADVHAGGGSDSEAFSAAENGMAFDNKGYLSTEASAAEGGGGKQVTVQQTSTEEAIADILEDTEVPKKDSNEGKKKKLALQKQSLVDLDNQEMFKFVDEPEDGHDSRKSSAHKKRQFTFDERDEDFEEGCDSNVTPLRQFTFDEGDEELHTSKDLDVDGEDICDTLGSLPEQFTFDEIDEDIRIPPLRQFTFDDSEDSDTQIEEASKKMSKDTNKMPLRQATSTAKETDSDTDSTSKDDTKADKPKMSKAHAERIRMRKKPSLGSLSSKGGRAIIKRTRSDRNLGKKPKGKSFEGLRKDGTRSKARSDASSLDCSLSWDTTDDEKSQEPGPKGGTWASKGSSECGDSQGSGKQRRVGLMRRLPPISLDSSFEKMVNDESVEGREGSSAKDGKEMKEDEDDDDDTDESDEIDKKGGESEKGKEKEKNLK